MDSARERGGGCWLRRVALDRTRSESQSRCEGSLGAASLRPCARTPGASTGPRLTAVRQNGRVATAGVPQSDRRGTTGGIPVSIARIERIGNLAQMPRRWAGAVAALERLIAG